MENPRVVVGVDQVVDALLKMRGMLVHRMKSPDITPVVFNECRKHVLQIDAQINQKRVPVTLDPMPHRVWTRAQRRAHQRKAGNTFTQRMDARK